MDNKLCEAVLVQMLLLNLGDWLLDCKFTGIVMPLSYVAVMLH